MIDSVKDRDSWRVLGNAILNRKVPYTMQLVKYTGNIPLGRPRRSWDYNIRMHLKELISGVGLIQLRIGIIGEPL